MAKLQFDKNEQFKITLPKQILLAKGWKKGDKIDVVLDNSGNIVLRNNINNKRNENEISQQEGYSTS